jgi:hypothetical protein
VTENQLKQRGRERKRERERELNGWDKSCWRRGLSEVLKTHYYSMAIESTFSVVPLSYGFLLSVGTWPLNF